MTSQTPQTNFTSTKLKSIFLSLWLLGFAYCLRQQVIQTSYIFDVVPILAREQKYLLQDYSKAVSTPEKTKILAVAEGKILEADLNAKFGNYLVAHTAYEEAVSAIVSELGTTGFMTFIFVQSQGQFEADSGHYEEALLILRRLADEWKDTSGDLSYRYLDAQNDVADVLQRQGKSREAIEAYKINAVLAQSRATDSPDAFLSQRYCLSSLASAYFNQKQYQHSAKIRKLLVILLQIHKAKPTEEVDALQGLGRTELYLKEPEHSEVALEAFNRACRLDPTNPDNHYGIALSNVSLGNLLDAFKSFFWVLVCWIINLMAPVFLGISKLRASVDDSN